MVEVIKDSGDFIVKHHPDIQAVDQLAVGSILSENGYTLVNQYPHAQDKTALTNLVFDLVVTDPEGKRKSAVVKVSLRAREPREIRYTDGDRVVGGWTKNHLENEYRVLTLVHNSGVKTPEPLVYQRQDGQIEYLVESRLIGRRCSDLRPSQVGMGEYVEMEREKGRMLAKINATPAPGSYFGTLDDNAQRFGKWNDYFGLKMVTTMSLLGKLYEPLCRLRYFNSLVGTPTEWQAFLKNVSTMYSSLAVARLLDEDNVPTLSHGDYWDGNVIGRMKGNRSWDLSVIDFDRGGVEGKSFDLALWLASKTTSKKQVNPIIGVPDFVSGYQEVGGVVSPDIQKYVAIYGLWQYLDFLLIDVVHGTDRSNKAIKEVKRLYSKIGLLI